MTPGNATNSIAYRGQDKPSGRVERVCDIAGGAEVAETAAQEIPPRNPDVGPTGVGKTESQPGWPG